MYPTNNTNHNNNQKILVNNDDSIREIILLPYTQRVHGQSPMREEEDKYECHEYT